jgi:hypothetical protein
MNIESAAQGTEDDKLAELLRETAMHNDGFEKATSPHNRWGLVRPLPERAPARSSPHRADAAADRCMEEVSGLTPR